MYVNPAFRIDHALCLDMVPTWLHEHVQLSGPN